MPENRDDLVTALTREWTRLGAELVLLVQGVADRLKINITDLQCLAVIASAGPMTAGQVAEATGLTTGAITGVIDRLEKAGLATRESDPGDRRRVVVRAVAAGALAARDDALGQVLSRLEAEASELYEGYSDRELRLVIDSLARAHPVIQERVADMRRHSPAQHELAGPTAGAEAGRLHLAPGVGIVTIDSATMPGLYRAHVEGTPPLIEVDGGTVTVKPRRFALFGWGHRVMQLTLSDAIPWDVEVAQGAWRLNADMSGLRVRSFLVKGGASNIDLRFGRPSGAVPVNIQGGASRVTLHRPGDVPIELHVRGGASRVSIDGRELGPMGGNLVWPDPPVAAGPDRYVVEVRGGASRLSIDAD